MDEESKRQDRIARIIRLIKSGHATSAEPEIQKEVARYRNLSAQKGDSSMDSIKAKALQLLEISNSTRDQYLVREAHEDTVAKGDSVFNLIGDSEDYAKLAGIINACAEFRDGYLTVLQGLNTEIKIIALKYLGGQA